MNMQTIHHKKNEIQEVEFFKDKECTEDFDFKNAKNLYIELVSGDCTPIFALSNKLSGLGIKARIFTPIWHLGWRDGISPQTPLVTLADVLDGEDSSNVNLSKYIPEDNAVLFLSDDDTRQYVSLLPQRHCSKFIKYDKFLESEWIVNRVNKGIDITTKPITIFLHHGTQAEIEKAEEVAKYLWKNFGIKPNAFVLHSFIEIEIGSKFHTTQWGEKVTKYINRDFSIPGYGEPSKEKYLMTCVGKGSFGSSYGYASSNKVFENINKVITTNSTGILPVQDTERLQVIDCKEIFEDSLKEII